jgi:hypothetical protein
LISFAVRVPVNVVVPVIPTLFANVVSLMIVPGKEAVPLTARLPPKFVAPDPRSVNVFPEDIPTLALKVVAVLIPPANEDDPETVKFPPRLVAPELTLSVFEEARETFPEKDVSETPPVKVDSPETVNAFPRIVEPITVRFPVLVREEAVVPARPPVKVDRPVTVRTFPRSVEPVTVRFPPKLEDPDPVANELEPEIATGALTVIVEFAVIGALVVMDPFNVVDPVTDRVDPISV